MTKELQGKIALVTGGSRGIGRAISVALAGQGAKVYINFASNSTAAEETVALCKEHGAEAEIIGFNVSDSDAVETAFQQIKKSDGKLDILVNNAGITADGLCMRMSDEDWNKVIATNLSGAFYCARAASKMMMRAKSGRIINISSVVGETGNPGQVNYVSSKAGLIGMTKSMAKELASRNVTVNAITPGFIATDMTAVLDEKTKTELLASIPLGRLGDPDDIAAAVLYLASGGSSYVTGQTIRVNGGMAM